MPCWSKLTAGILLNLGLLAGILLNRCKKLRGTRRSWSLPGLARPSDLGLPCCKRRLRPASGAAGSSALSVLAAKNSEPGVPLDSLLASKAAMRWQRLGLKSCDTSSCRNRRDFTPRARPRAGVSLTSSGAPVKFVELHVSCRTANPTWPRPGGLACLRDVDGVDDERGSGREAHAEGRDLASSSTCCEADANGVPDLQS